MFTSHESLSSSRTLKTGFGQIDITLDPAEGLVVDGLVAAERNDGVAFGLQGFPGQFLKVFREQALDAFFMRNFTAQLPDTVGVFGTKAFYRLMPSPTRRFDCFEPSESCFVGLQTRQSFFFFCDMIVHNSEPTNQGRKRQSLQNEGCEDDTEGEQEDKVASWEWFAAGQQKRDCEPAGKRIGPAHPDPCNHGGVLPGNAVFAAGFSVKQARQVVSTKHPDKTNQDNDQNDFILLLEHASRHTGSEGVHDLWQLQADEHEEHAVQNERDHFPNRQRL